MAILQNFISHFIFFQIFNAILFLFQLQYDAKQVHAHGVMNFPNPRGCLNNRSTFIYNLVDSNAPGDYKPHFPAGNKNQQPGSGHRSQIKAAGAAGWMEYEPLRPGFVWRAGVCGDMIPPHPQQHLIGGRYYYNGKIVKTYRSGGQISIGLSINAHHNGFMLLHVCDISKCSSGDISEQCFQVPGACIQLKRARNIHCDMGYSKLCSPIDRNHPGRWYFPCTKYPRDDYKIDRWGYGVSSTILYDIPENWHCDHCVLQWFWTSAHTCNPTGVVEYFTGPDRPKSWGDCYGQGGAKGGFTKVQKPCSKHRFPEEYLHCADIRIKKMKIRESHSTKPSPKISPQKNEKPTVLPSISPRLFKRPSPQPKTSSITKPIESNKPTETSNRRNGKEIQSSPSPRKKFPISSYISDQDIEAARMKGIGGVRAFIFISNGYRYKILDRKYNILKVPVSFWICIEVLLDPRARNVTFLVNDKITSHSTGPRFYGTGNVARDWGKLNINQWNKVTAIAMHDTDTIHIFIKKL